METAEKRVPSAFIGVFLVSLSALLLEISLTRLFSFTIWYHFSYLMINVALLGFGSSGILVTVLPRIVKSGGNRLLVACPLFSSVSVLLFFLIAAKHPLQPAMMVTNPLGLFGSIALYYVGVSVPFFFGGLAVIVPLKIYSSRISQFYFWDLAGAGFGACLSVVVLNWAGAPGGILAAAAGLILAAAFFALPVSRLATVLLLLLGVTGVVSVHHLSNSITVIPSKSTYVGRIYTHPSEYNSHYMEWNAVGRVDVYHDAYPKQYGAQWTYDGISKSYPADGPRPDFYYMMYESHNRSDIFQFNGNREDPYFLDSHLLRTPYLIRDHPKVLIIGSGGGIDVINAYRNNASSIVAVELQPVVAKLLKGQLAPWVSNIYNKDPNIQLFAAEGRNFIRRDTNKYDLIQLTSTDTWSANNSGAYVLSESYLYTQDALSQYLDHLKDDGVLCLLVWDLIEEEGKDFRQPINSRLIMQYLNVLESKGITPPGEHFVILGKKEWYHNIFTVPLVKKIPFTRDEVDKLRAFAAEKGFSVLYDPFHDNPPNALSKIIGASDQERHQMAQDSFYDLTATTDDRPFFFSCFKWKNILYSEVKWDAPVYGQLFLLVMLAQSLIFSFLFILTPLFLSKRTSLDFHKSKGYLVYFLALGAGFIFFELSMIQRFVLLLGYPTYAFSATVFSLLISAGIGSYSSGRLKIEPGRLIKIVAITLCLTVIGWLGLSAYLFHLFIGSSLAVRFLVTVALQAPLGLLLGMFFPLGIRLVHQADERMIPWVWAANGLSSVVGTVVAILLAMSFGFRWVTFAAAGIYIVGTLSISLTGKRTVESGQTSTNLDSDGEPAHSVLVPVQPDNLGV